MRSTNGRWNTIAWRIPPSRRIAPALGRSSPCSTRSSVLLPLPLAPISATRSPRAIARSTPCSARTAP